MRARDRAAFHEIRPFMTARVTQVREVPPARRTHDRHGRMTVMRQRVTSPPRHRVAIGRPLPAVRALGARRAFVTGECERNAMPARRSQAGTAPEARASVFWDGNFCFRDSEPDMRRAQNRATVSAARVSFGRKLLFPGLGTGDVGARRSSCSDRPAAGYSSQRATGRRSVAAAQWSAETASSARCASTQRPSRHPRRPGEPPNSSGPHRRSRPRPSRGWHRVG